MSDGDRGSGFAFVTALTVIALLSLLIAMVFHLGWRNGEAEGEYAANSDTYAKHAQEQIEGCFKLADDPAKSKCVREVVKAQNEHERAEADLVAQTEMGLWAFGMLIVTGVMALVFTTFGERSSRPKKPV